MQANWLATLIIPAMSLLWMSQATADDRRETPARRADPILGKAPGDVRDDNCLRMKLVWCPPGSVTMQDVEQVSEPAVERPGDRTAKSDESDDDVVDRIIEPVPQSRVTTKITRVKAFLTTGYWIGKFEVIQSEWKQVMNTEPWKGKQCAKEGDDYPVTYVDWDDSLAFCRKLTEREREAGRLPDGWEYTLPTEAQWERACRARTDSVFSFGDDSAKLGDYAWFHSNAMGVGEQFAHRIGQKKPNPWGLYDMHGNVFEWCRDVYAQKLPGGRDPDTTGTSPLRIFRGGSWCMEGSYCRSADRSYPATKREYTALGVGLRVALCVVTRDK
jgi:formylglycine-generating enzyme required for sulfatase activity